jgi:hypothetical protein
MMHPYSPAACAASHSGFLANYLLLVLLVSVSSLAQTKVYYSVSYGNYNTTNDQLRSIPLTGGRETIVAPNASGNSIAPSQVAYDATNDRVFVANAVGDSPVIHVVSATGVSPVFKTLANILSAVTTILNDVVVDNVGHYLRYILSDNVFGSRLDQLRRIPLGGGDEEVFVGSGTANFPATPSALALDRRNNRLLVSNSVASTTANEEGNNLYVSAVDPTSRAVTKPITFADFGVQTNQGGIGVNTTGSAWLPPCPTAPRPAPR